MFKDFFVDLYLRFAFWWMRRNPVMRLVWTQIKDEVHRNEVLKTDPGEYLQRALREVHVALNGPNPELAIRERLIEYADQLARFSTFRFNREWDRETAGLLLEVPYISGIQKDRLPELAKKANFFAALVTSRLSEDQAQDPEALASLVYFSYEENRYFKNVFATAYLAQQVQRFGKQSKALDWFLPFYVSRCIAWDIWSLIKLDIAPNEACLRPDFLRLHLEEWDRCIRDSSNPLVDWLKAWERAFPRENPYGVYSLFSMLYFPPP